jgi:Helix-turn-helix domain
MSRNVNYFEQQSNVNLEEMAKARPPRGSGAPLRTRSHYERILALLRERGTTGVLSTELYDAPRLFGRSPRNRISDLRKHGHLIETKPAGPSSVRYVLLRENSSSKDWFEHSTGRKRPGVGVDLPLFSE